MPILYKAPRGDVHNSPSQHGDRLVTTARTGSHQQAATPNYRERWPTVDELRAEAVHWLRQNGVTDVDTSTLKFNKWVYVSCGEFKASHGKISYQLNYETTYDRCFPGLTLAWKVRGTLNRVSKGTIDTFTTNKRADFVAPAATQSRRSAPEALSLVTASAELAVSDQSAAQDGNRKKVAIARQDWDRARPVDPDSLHPYLIAKRLRSCEGLRVARDGVLLIPFSRASTGEFQGFQKIWQEAAGFEKRYRGPKKEGCFFLGDPQHATTIAIAEGYATAASVREATEWCVVTAFDCGNLLPVATAIRKRFPEHTLVIAADNDVIKHRARVASGDTTSTNVGVVAAADTARVVRAHIAVPPVEQIADFSGSDWNDVAQVWSPEMVREALLAVLDDDPLSELTTLPPALGATGSKPLILLQDGGLSTQTDQAIDVLRGANLSASDGGLFRQDGRLVRVIRQTTSRCLPGAHGIQIIGEHVALESVDAPHITRLLASNVKLMRHDARRRGLVPVDPPERVVQQVLARRGIEAPARELRGITTAPIWDPQRGIVVQEPGYHEQQQIYVAPSDVTFPEIPKAPTRDDALAALERLMTPFEEYTFELPEHRSVVLAALLSGVTRRLLPECPLYVIDAADRSYGKTLLTKTLAICTSGAVGGIMPAVRPEELEKSVTAMVLSGAPVAIIDNVEGNFGNAWFAGALTSETVNVRLFGTLNVRQAPSTALWMVTANNVVLSEDIAARSLTVRIVSNKPDPASHRYQRDLVQWAQSHWPQMVADAITVLRAHYLANGGELPPGVAPYNKFKVWDKAVRGALLWLNQADPIATTRRAMEGAPDRVALRNFLRSVYAAFEGNSWTARTLVEAAQIGGVGRRSLSAEVHDDLARALQEFAPSRVGDDLPKPTTLGHKLTQHRDQRVGAFRLELVDQDSKRGNAFAVRRTDG